MKVSTARFESGHNKERVYQPTFSEIPFDGWGVIVEFHGQEGSEDMPSAITVREQGVVYGGLAYVEFERRYTSANLLSNTDEREPLFKKIRRIQEGAWASELGEKQGIFFERGRVYEFVYTDQDGREAGLVRIDLTL